MRRGFELASVGSGYAGLVTGACVADVDEGRIADLRAGSLPLYEPGFEELREGSVRCSTSRKRWLLATGRIARVKSRRPAILAGKEAS
jgi:UDP-glucose 6-dehydrogenase